MCLTIEEASGGAIGVWPDNLAAVNVFIAISTQWRTSGFGATGLDYNVLYRKMDRLDLSESEYDDMEECIRVMEQAALKTMRENRD